MEIIFCIVMSLFFVNLERRRCFEISVCTSSSIAANKLINQWILYAEADEKTEDASQKKLRDSRKKGQIAKSQDLNVGIGLMVVALLIKFLGNRLFYKILKFLHSFLNDELTTDIGISNFTAVLTGLMVVFFKIVWPVFMVIMTVGVISNLGQHGFLFSKESIKMDFKKLNPIEGFKKMFSKKTFFNLMKNLSKFTIIGFVSYKYVVQNIEKILSLTRVKVVDVSMFMSDLVYGIVLKIAIAMLIIGAIDFLYEKYDYKKKQKMTKHEVKQEMKQMEGDPHIKAKRKQKQREIAMQRMMSDVSKATVIITNPTHIAIAIRYDPDEDEVPVMLAKGADHVAAKIKESVVRKEIPIIENKPLARVLYKEVEIGSEIPAELYQAVAEILALVYRMKKKNKI